MLDVMKTPPPVIEQITWHASRTRMPDHGKTVLIYLPDEAEHGEPVWMGYFDDSDGRWCNVEGFPLPMVTWWADVPAGPTEPQAGQVQDARPLVQCTMEHVTSMVFQSDAMPLSVSRNKLQTIVHTLCRGLGLQALGGRHLCIDLANSHSLLVQVKHNGEVQG